MMDRKGYRSSRCVVSPMQRVFNRNRISTMLPPGYSGVIGTSRRLVVCGRRREDITPDMHGHCGNATVHGAERVAGLWPLGVRMLSLLDGSWVVLVTQERTTEWACLQTADNAPATDDGLLTAG